MNSLKFTIAALFLAVFISCTNWNSPIYENGKMRERIKDSLIADSIQREEYLKKMGATNDSIINAQKEMFSFTPQNSEIIYFDHVNYCSDFPDYQLGVGNSADAIISIKKKKNLLNINIVGEESFTCFINNSFKDLQIDLIVTEKDQLREGSYFYLAKNLSPNDVWGILLINRGSKLPNGITYRFATLMYDLGIRGDNKRGYFKHMVQFSYTQNENN